MGNYTIFKMFKNPRRGRHARNFTTNVPKILDLKSSSEQISFRKLTLGATGKDETIEFDLVGERSATKVIQSPEQTKLS